MKDNKVSTHIHMRYVNSLADTFKEIPELHIFSDGQTLLTWLPVA